MSSKEKKILQDIIKNSEVQKMKHYTQHGKVSAYAYCMNVARLSLRIDRRLSLHSDKKVLLTGAMLHDFYLYDWHEIDGGSHRLHGFTHPKAACDNARRVFDIDERTARVITCSFTIMEEMVLGSFEVKECNDTEVIKELFKEYSQIKGAESCFVSFDKELADLKAFYSGGALLIGYEDAIPAACIALKKIDEKRCEAKRLFIKPEFRGKGYARIMLNMMLDTARTIGFREVTFTTKPSVMQIGYGLYKRMGFEEVSEENEVVSMRMAI